VTAHDHRFDDFRHPSHRAPLDQSATLASVLLLEFPVVLEAPGLFLFLAGATAIAVRGPEAQTPAGDVFTPFVPDSVTESMNQSR
jgi:hypothetical protein